MSEGTASDAEADAAETATEDEVWRRDTAPQTPFTLRQVGVGMLIAVIAAVVAFVVPLTLV